MEFKFTFFYFLKNTYKLQFGSKSILSLFSLDFEHFVLFLTLSASRTDLFGKLDSPKMENEARAATLSSHRYSLKMNERLHESTTFGVINLLFNS